jgi:hypothetical protein
MPRLVAQKLAPELVLRRARKAAKAALEEAALLAADPAATSRSTALRNGLKRRAEGLDEVATILAGK